MPANWAAGFHQKLKAREDREELARRSESDKAGTANRNLTFDVYMGLAVALVGFNWWLWQNGNILIWIFVDASVLAFGFLILCVGYKLRSKRGSSNFDEAEVRKKLGSHALEAEMSRVNYICRLASISFAGSPPWPGRVAGQRWSGSWGRQTPG